jgi:glutamate 5-kinase
MPSESCSRTELTTEAPHAPLSLHRMVICNANRMDEIPQCIDGTVQLGTMFLPPENIMRGRKRWILSMPVRGQIVLDKGAVRAVLKHKVRHAPLLKDEDENPVDIL